MRRSKLPKAICSLDIETGANRELLLAGIVPYTLHRGSYWPGRYRWFTPSTVNQLEQFLKTFPGLILGHNILHFDYQVLDEFISLDRIIEKTVDTLYFLHRKHGLRTAGLGLDALSRINLKRGKVDLNVKNLSKLWHHGHRKKVLEYNKTDCLLTKALWWHLIKQKSIEVHFKDSYESFLNQESYSITDEDRATLVCQRPMFSFRTWKEQLEHKGYILRTKNIIRDVVYWFYCRRCKSTYLFESRVLTGYRTKEEVHCQKCKGLLGEMRQDRGCVLLGSLQGNLGDGHSTSCIPEEFRDLLVHHLEKNNRASDRYSFMKGWKDRESFSAIMTTDGDEVDIALQWSYCNGCMKTYVFEHKLKINKRRKHFSCPGCRKPLQFTDNSGDNTFIGELDANFGNGRSQGVIREDFVDIVLSYLEASSSP